MSGPCSDCHDAGYIRIDKGTHIDEVPCESCIAPLRDCSRGHQLISFRGVECPLCAALSKPSEPRA